VLVENNLVRTDNRKFVNVVEEIQGGGSGIFLDERFSSDNTLNPRSSFFAEIMKMPFYLSIPTQTNFVFQKRKLTFLVFFCSLIVIFVSLRFISWIMLLWAAGLGLLLFLLQVLTQHGTFDWLNELLAAATVIGWTVILSNLFFTALSFLADAWQVEKSAVFFWITAVSDWNLSWLISDSVHLDFCAGVRIGLLRFYGDCYFNVDCVAIRGTV